VTGSSVAELHLSSSTDSVKVPDTVVTRPGQWSAEFQVDALAPVTDESAAITVQLGADSVTENLEIRSGRRAPLNVPSHLAIKFGNEVRLQVASPGMHGAVSATSLPLGASFDPISGLFQWIPGVDQQGTYDLPFTAAGLEGDMTTELLKLEVDSGLPVITRIVNAASRSQKAPCSPGALATIEGRWLADDSVASKQPPGTTVQINGAAVPVLYASPTRVDFQCPDSQGSTLAIVVETAQGGTQPVEAAAGSLAPGIFSVDGSGSGQGAVMHAGSSNFAMVPNYRYAAQTAQAGDHLVIYATGIDGAMRIAVNVGGIETTPDSITPLPGYPGVSQVSFTLPQSTIPGETVDLSLTGLLWDGTTTNSNRISIAIEN
jgi:uncharacterized protein (TIGR03437 family)